MTNAYRDEYPTQYSRVINANFAWRYGTEWFVYPVLVYGLRHALVRHRELKKIQCDPEHCEYHGQRRIQRCRFYGKCKDRLTIGLVGLRRVGRERLLTVGMSVVLMSVLKNRKSRWTQDPIRSARSDTVEGGASMVQRWLRVICGR